jgi:hypothetical protein
LKHVRVDELDRAFSILRPRATRKGYPDQREKCDGDRLSRARHSSPTHAFCFRLFELRRLIVVLGRSSTRNRVLRAGAQIDVNVVEVAHHILVIGEGGHDFFLTASEILLATGDDPEELGVADRFERVRERRGVGRASPSGPWQTWHSEW